MPTEMQIYANGKIDLEDDIGADFVIGFDEHISCPKVLAKVLASNADENIPMEIHLVVPGNGVMVKGVKTRLRQH